MTDAPKLKPCPFCGNSDVKKSSVTGGIFCEECGCDGPWSPFFEGDWNTRADLIDMDVLRRAEAALKWHENSRKDALARTALNAPEDPNVEALCERYGYGAVIDAAARLWARKDPKGAFYIGGCIGGSDESQALTALRAMMEKLK